MTHLVNMKQPLFLAVLFDLMFTVLRDPKVSNFSRNASEIKMYFEYFYYYNY